MSFSSMVGEASRSTIRRQKSSGMEDKSKESIRKKLVLHKRNSQGRDAMGNHAHLIGGQIMKHRTSGRKLVANNNSQRSLTAQTTKDRIALEDLEQRREQ